MQREGTGSNDRGLATKGPKEGSSCRFPTPELLPLPPPGTHIESHQKGLLEYAHWKGPENLANSLYRLGNRLKEVAPTPFPIPPHPQPPRASRLQPRQAGGALPRRPGPAAGSARQIPKGKPLKEFFLSRELTASIQPRGLKGEHRINALQMCFLPLLATAARRAWSGGGGHSLIQAVFSVPPANFFRL